MSTAATKAVAALIPAAGSGTRLGHELPKAFVEIDGLTLVARSALAMSALADTIVVAVPEEYLETARAALDVVDADVHIVIGGAQRQDSVAACLAVLPEDIEYVLVHDAARPLVPEEVTWRVVAGLHSGAQAVIPVLPIADTIKRVNSQGVVTSTVDRDELRRVQTPQGFAIDTLRAAYADPTHVATDDAGLMESMGVAVVTVPGDERAFKITTPEDLARAEALAQQGATL